MRLAPDPPEPTRRLFFALWPDERQRAALAQAVGEGVRRGGGRPVPAQSLHVTLSFLGSTPARRVPELARVARRIAGEARAVPLVLEFDSIVHWPRPQILAALAREATAASVRALADALTSAAAAAGFGPDLKPFHAHVTLARKIGKAPASQELRPLQWRFEAFALIESRTHPGGAAYSIVESYSLVGAEKVRT